LTPLNALTILQGVTANSVAGIGVPKQRRKSAFGDEQSRNSCFAPVKSVRGGQGGSATYACKELVYAYAMWISAKFHLAVIRAFDALVSGQTPALPEPPTITRAQAGELAALVAERSGETGKNRAYYWSRFNNHFRLARYRDLPAERFDEAVEYLKTMPDEQGNRPALPKHLTPPADGLLCS